MVFTPGFLLRTDAGANLELFEGETMRPKLTTQQQEVLDSINRHARQNGTPPSIRQIGRALGMSSTNAVRQHLRALIKEGYVQRAPDVTRAVVVGRDEL